MPLTLHFRISTIKAAAFTKQRKPTLFDRRRHGDAGRIGPPWLIACYVLITPGEIWLSACGLSLVTRLAPPRMTARLTGLWFAAAAVGNWLGGALGLLWPRWPHHRYFAVVAALTLSAAVALLYRRERIEASVGSRRVPSESHR